MNIDNLAIILASKCGQERQAFLHKFGLLDQALTPEIGLSLSNTEGNFDQHDHALAEQINRDCQHFSIQQVNIFSKDYPESLRSIYAPPAVLYFKGDLQCLNRSLLYLSIVGSRSASLQSWNYTADLSERLGNAGVCIVSGLALGIDGAAHQGALLSGKLNSTIAVLAHGLDSIYPRRHSQLADRILSQNGLILSQFPPGTPAYPNHFLMRNQIIAGLSTGTLVIQAGLRSGSLVTARYALEEGRDVLAVPGDVLDPLYAGSNQLIKQGAYLITGFSDLEAHYPEFLNTPQDAAQLPADLTDSKIGKTILNLLSAVKSLHFDQLIAQIKIDRSILVRELSQLEIDRLVQRLPGNFIALRSR